jgi:hypothetical protein
MFGHFKNGWHLIVMAFQVLFMRPRLLIPLIGCWLLYAPTLIYMTYQYPWDRYSTTINLLVLFGLLFFFSLIISFSCLILLNLIEQLEQGGRMSFFSAFGQVIRYELWKALPIMLIWTILWFILTLISIVFSKSKESSKEMTPENATRTLAGFDNFSFSKAFINTIEKGLRMVVFLILPGIVWESLSPVAAMKRGLFIFKTRLGEFATGFVLTELAAGILFLPPGIILIIASKLEIEFPLYVWVATIIYCAFAWSAMLFLEQMFAAELYLWHLSWEKELSRRGLTADALALSDVKRPSVLDEIPDLAVTFSTFSKPAVDRQH